MCGEARQSGSKKGMEGRKEGGVGGGQLLNNFCTSSPPSFLRPFSKPPNPAIRQISLCHPWNAGDNYRLSTDTRPLSSHRHSADPTVHIPTIEGEVEVEGTEGKARGGVMVSGWRYNLFLTAS